MYIVPFRIGFETLQHSHIVRIGSSFKSRNPLIRIIGIFTIVQRNSTSAWVRTGPHQQAHPLQVVMEAKVAKRSICLLLKLRSDSNESFSALSPRTKRRSDLFAKGNCKRRVSYEVSTVIDEVTNDGWLPDSQD